MQFFGWCNSRYNIDSALAYNTPSSDTGAQVGGLYADNTRGGNMRVYTGIGTGGSTYYDIQITALLLHDMI